MRDQRKAKVRGVERYRRIDIVDHVADVDCLRFRLLGPFGFCLALSPESAVVLHLHLLRLRFLLGSLRACFAACHSAVTPPEKMLSNVPESMIDTIQSAAHALCRPGATGFDHTDDML